MESGGNFAQLLKAVQWRSTACNLYLDLGAQKAAAAVETMIGRCDYEGPGERPPLF